jgi:type IV pilus assembly protein PilB
MVTAQRLVRRLCGACRTPADDLAAWRAVACDGADDGLPYSPRGCAACHGIGYRGRIGVHEVMPVSDAMRELIVRRAGSHEIARQARAERVAGLREAALARVCDGTTSLDEALAATEAA